MPMMGVFPKERPRREGEALVICADMLLALSSNDQGFASRRLKLRSSPPPLPQFLPLTDIF